MVPCTALAANNLPAVKVVQGMCEGVCFLQEVGFLLTFPQKVTRNVESFKIWFETKLMEFCANDSFIFLCYMIYLGILLIIMNMSSYNSWDS